MLSRLPALCLCTLALTAPACVGPSYVNIPSEGGIAASDPNSFNVREIVADSIAAALEREPVSGAFEVVLPEGSDQTTYQSVVRKIGGGAVAPDTLRDRPLPTVTVVAVRIRTGEAECDLVRPSSTGRSVTRVFLDYAHGNDWVVRRVKPLRISPNELRLQTATPPPAAPVEAEGAAS